MKTLKIVKNAGGGWKLFFKNTGRGRVKKGFLERKKRCIWTMRWEDDNLETKRTKMGRVHD